MRIPWYIVIPLSLAVFITVLWLGARNQDFTTAPSPAEVQDALTQWKAKHPPLPARQQPLPAPHPAVAQQATAIAELPVGDLLSSPALDHYAAYANSGSKAYIQLAHQLQQKGHPAHALLAWERCLDSTDTSSTDSLLAHRAISELRQQLAPWNADSSQNFDLVLNIDTPASWKAPLSAVLGELSQDIAQASSLIIAPQVRIRTIQQREGFPPPPVKIWLSSTGETAKQTPLFTFHPKTEDSSNTQSIKEQLYGAIFRCIAAQLDSVDGCMPPAAITPQDSASTALTTHLTRLHWKKFADSLALETKKPAAAIIIEEDTKDE